eukprot:5103641-Amphidinium_carterae.1
MLLPELRLQPETFAQEGQPEAHDQHLLLQELIRRSYIQFHPTSGYSKATEEIKDIYDLFCHQQQLIVGTTSLVH